MRKTILESHFSPFTLTTQKTLCLESADARAHPRFRDLHDDVHVQLKEMQVRYQPQEHDLLILIFAASGKIRSSWFDYEPPARNELIDIYTKSH